MRPVTLVAILTALALLFAAGVGLGAWQGDGRVAGRAPGWAQGLGDLLVSRQRLTGKDIRSATPPVCGDQLGRGSFSLDQGQSCVLEIRASDLPQRTLTLRLSEGGAAQITLDHRGDVLTAQQSLTGAADKKEVYVFAEGGTLTLTCVLAAPSAACLITVQ